MIITNNYGLSDRTYSVIRDSMNEYSSEGSDYSVTTLIKAPRQVQLERRHGKKLRVDARELYWAFWGNLGHLALSKYATGIGEKRFFMDVGGIRVSGQTDHYDPVTKIITDYKFVWVNALNFLHKKSEWPAQLNLYACLLRANGYEVAGAEIEAFCRDWKQKIANCNHNYPSSPVIVIKYKLWEPNRALEFLIERVKYHSFFEDKPDDELPDCTPDEKWETTASWAVMKDKSKRALKVFPSLQAAQEYQQYRVKKEAERVEKLKAANERRKSAEHPVTEAGACKSIRKSKFTIEPRQGHRMKCEEYCLVKEYCNSWHEYKAMMDKQQKG